MFKLIPLTIMMFIIAACSGNEKSTWPLPPQVETASPARVSTQTTSNQNTSISDDFVIQETYNGKNIVLNFPHDYNLGEWIIRNEEAQEIYKNLNIEPAVGNETTDWLPIETKYARHILCSQFTPRADPENKSFSCKLGFDYLTGNVNEVVSAGLLKMKINTINATDDDPVGIIPTEVVEKINSISIQGNDAKALYLTLNIGITTIEENEIIYNKKSNMFDCRSNPITNNYSCYVHIKAATGELEFPQN